MGFLLNFKLIIGSIGIILIAFNILLLLPFPLPLIFIIPWVFLQIFQDAMLGYGVFQLSTTVGLVMYIIGRKEFLNHLKRGKIASILLTISGVIFVGESLWFLFFNIMLLQTSFGAPRTIRDWIIYLILFSWSGFVFMSGVLWLIDGIKKGEIKALPLKKEIDFEEAWKKYPKDLFAKYVKQYPHNPSGVLEWHIAKRMKKGITREQAIEELTKEIE